MFYFSNMYLILLEIGLDIHCEFESNVVMKPKFSISLTTEQGDSKKQITERIILKRILKNGANYF